VAAAMTPVTVVFSVLVVGVGLWFAYKEWRG
jgi:hypothetical protein